MRLETKFQNQYVEDDLNLNGKHFTKVCWMINILVCLMDQKVSNSNARINMRMSYSGQKMICTRLIMIFAITSKQWKCWRKKERNLIRWLLKNKKTTKSVKEHSTS
jgi:hypothetical protein